MSKLKRRPEGQLLTQVEYGEFNGHKILEIWKIDTEGFAVGDKPLMSFGIQKAKTKLSEASLIENHKNEIQNFILSKEE